MIKIEKIEEDKDSKINKAYKLINGLYEIPLFELITTVTKYYPETSKQYKIADILLEYSQDTPNGQEPTITREKARELGLELYELLIQQILNEQGLENAKYYSFKTIKELRKWKFENLEFKHIDEATEKPKSLDEQVINDLQIHFKPSKTFKGINNEVIKQKLGLNITDKKLKQLIKKTFKNIKIRGSDNYFLETI